MKNKIENKQHKSLIINDNFIFDRQKIENKKYKTPPN